MHFDTRLIDDVRNQLLKRKDTIATAESVTAGNIQAALSLANEATKFFQGGITAFNLGQKTRHLAVEPIEGNDTNCVAPAVAATMAVEASKMFLSTIGVAITGYASIVPENEREGLFAWVAMSYRGQVVVTQRITSPHNGDMHTAQVHYTNQVLQLLLNWLQQQQAQNMPVLQNTSSP